MKVPKSVAEKTLEKLLSRRKFILRDTDARMKELAKKINEQLKKIAIEKGEIVQSVEDLKCPHHPDAKFIKAKEIENSYIFAARKKGEKKTAGLAVYGCEVCLKECKIGQGLLGSIPPGASTAYECPECGIVKGIYATEHYRSSEESWRNLAGREGNHFFCRICNAPIGFYHWRVS